MRDKAYGLIASEDGDECGKEGDETGNVQQDMDQADVRCSASVVELQMTVLSQSTGAHDRERRVKDLGGCTVFAQWLCLHEAKPPPTSGSPLSITWHSFLQTTTSVVDGFNLSTFERARWRSLKDGYSHPIPDRCKECL